MNRRGFFGTLAAIAVYPFVTEPSSIPSCSELGMFAQADLQSLFDDGGFLVPKEFEPLVLNARKWIGKLHMPDELLADAEACRPLITLRTIDGQTVTREIA